MAAIKCPACEGKGGGITPQTGQPWRCWRCEGSGKVQPYRRVRRQARHPFPKQNLGKLPHVMTDHTEYVGYVVGVFEDGCNVDHEDGKLWAFYKWSEMPNGDEIKAAWEAQQTSQTENDASTTEPNKNG